MRYWRWVAAVLLAAGWTTAQAVGFSIESFDATGRLSYRTLADGTDYSYRVEWAPSPGGPWMEFGYAGAAWLNAKPQAAGAIVTNLVPMCYRVVATRGDYLSIDISGGLGAMIYPVTYYRTLADVPGGPNSDAYMTTNILMRLVPKGVFVMGSPVNELGGSSFTETAHQVTLTKDFYIGVFEVTQRQWELVMGDRPSYFSNVTYYASRPVEQVSYYAIREDPVRGDDPATSWPDNNTVHANSFMGKLRVKAGLEGFDLPTEAQWEYACRAGTATALNSGKNLTTTTVQGCVNLAEVGRYRRNGGGSAHFGDVDTSVATAKVGTYLSNDWGLYDMHGNVWEWCLDWYGTYTGTVTDPKGLSSGSDRIMRGGVWSDETPNCRSASRNVSPPKSASYAIGFRACCVPSP